MRAIARFSLNCEAHEPPVQSTYLLYALLIAPAREPSAVRKKVLRRSK